MSNKLNKWENQSAHNNSAVYDKEVLITEKAGSENEICENNKNDEQKGFGSSSQLLEKAEFRIKSIKQHGFYMRMLVYTNKILTILFILAQVALIWACFTWLAAKDAFYVWETVTVIGIIVIIYEMNRIDEPGYKTSWILLIAIFPLVGIPLYLLFHNDIVNRHCKERTALFAETLSPLLKQDDYIRLAMQNNAAEITGFADYIYQTGGYAAYALEKAEYYSMAIDMYNEILTSVQQAKKFVFLEYFVVDPGSRMWNDLQDILLQRIREGVEVRLIYDGFGSWKVAPDDLASRLSAIGINCRCFSRMIPLLANYLNNRDHRKMIIVDGEVVFTGGINLADKYINEQKDYIFWKDGGVRIEGEAVKCFTAMFLEQWNMMSKDHSAENLEKYFDFSRSTCGMSEKKEAETTTGNMVADPAINEFIIPFGDNPLLEHHLGEKTYVDIINNAGNNVNIITPYLAPDHDVLEALKYASRRGIDVNLLLPRTCDKKYMRWLGCSYYPELLQSGIKIYEFTPGIIHTKAIVSDNMRTVVGTINVDYRSFYLHYECSAYFHGQTIAAAVQNDFNDTLKISEKISLDIYNDYNIAQRCLGRILRLVAPLV